MPTISGITGAVTHGNSITISGTAFGAKAVAAPLVWDDASGPGDMLDLWHGAWPDQSWNIARDEQLARRNVIRGIQPPHARVGRYLCGAHNLDGNGSHARGGNNVMFWRSFARQHPVSVYQSCWMRADPSWVFNSQTDNNFKCYTFGHISAETGSPIAGNGFGAHYGGGWQPHSFDDTSIKWQSYGDLAPVAWSGIDDAVNVMTKWTKFELFWRIDDPGFVRVLENGRRVHSRTVNITEQTHRAFQTTSFGQYARVNNNPNNWRYYTDAYYDNSFSRVILGNNPSLNSSCTIREVQIPTAWSDTSVTVTVNRGVFVDDDPVYVFVVDANDVASDGFLVESAPSDAPPVITSPLSVSVVVGDTDVYTITAANNPTSFTATPLPSGRSLNPSTGVITGTYDEFGTTQAVIGATNEFGTDQETVTFEVDQSPSTGGIEDPVNIGTDANKVGSTLSVTAQQLVPAGNTIFVSVATRGGDTATGFPSCADNVHGPDSYTQDILQTTSSGSTKLSLYRLSNNNELPVGSVITVTIGNSISDSKSMTAFWVRGLNTFEPLDVFNSAAASAASTATNSGQITTTSTADLRRLMVGALCVAATDGDVVTQDPDYTSLVNSASTTGGAAGSDRVSFVGTRIISAAETNDYAPTISDTRFWVAGVVAYKADTTGGGTTPAPEITSVLVAETTEGASFTYEILATNNPITFSAAPLPTGLTLDGNGIISGNTGTGTAATYNILLEATNETGTGSATLVLTVHPPSPTPPGGTQKVRPLPMAVQLASGQVRVASRSGVKDRT